MVIVPRYGLLNYSSLWVHVWFVRYFVVEIVYRVPIFLYASISHTVFFLPAIVWPGAFYFFWRSLLNLIQSCSSVVLKWEYHEIYVCCDIKSWFDSAYNHFQYIFSTVWDCCNNIFCLSDEAVYNPDCCFVAGQTNIWSSWMFVVTGADFLALTEMCEQKIT